jgi:hypothetical protein
MINFLIINAFIEPAAIEWNIECARKFFAKNRKSEMDSLRH